MSRASGRRHSPRQPTPGTPAGDAIGMSERQQPGHSPIPGGATHLVNHPTEAKPPPNAVPRPPFRGMMAHGVPPEAVEHHDREGMSHARTAAPVTKLPESVAPVPVYVVQESGGTRPLRKTITRKVTVPAAGGEAVMLCPQDPHRARVLLLNEDTANLVRFGDIRQLTPGAGAIPAAVLPAVTNSYLTLHTQDELYAIADAASAVIVSVIMEYELPGGAG